MLKKYFPKVKRQRKQEEKIDKLITVLIDKIVHTIPEPQLYLQANTLEKKQILHLIGSNFSYKDKELSIVLNSAFDYLLNFDFSITTGMKRFELPRLYTGS